MFNFLFLGVLPLNQCTNATSGESNNGASSAFATKDTIQLSPLLRTVANPSKLIILRIQVLILESYKF